MGPSEAGGFSHGGPSGFSRRSIGMRLDPNVDRRCGALDHAAETRC
jgi:hypothetical protein